VPQYRKRLSDNGSIFPRDIGAPAAFGAARQARAGRSESLIKLLCAVQR